MTAPRRAAAPMPVFLTPAEVSRHLRVSPMTVYRLIHGDSLAAVRVGRSLRITRDSLDRFLRDHNAALEDVPW